MGNLTPVNAIKRRRRGHTMQEMENVDVIKEMRETACLEPTDEGHCKECIVCEGANRIFDLLERLEVQDKTLGLVNARLKEMSIKRDVYHEEVESLRNRLVGQQMPSHAQPTSQPTDALLKRLEALEKRAGPPPHESLAPPAADPDE